MRKGANREWFSAPRLRGEVAAEQPKGGFLRLAVARHFPRFAGAEDNSLFAI